MRDGIEFTLSALLIGGGATVTMDLWAVLLKRFGIQSLDLGLLGRWIGYFPTGQFTHDSIAKAVPVRGERVIGWCAHYAIGIMFATLLLSIWGLKWARTPSLFPALFIGLMTVIAPFCIMQPAMGAGIAAAKAPAPNIARTKSILAHAVYGFGLYGSALLAARVIVWANTGGG